MITKRTLTEADRQQARYNLLTPGAVANRLQEMMGAADPKAKITPDTVRSWIEDEREEFRLQAVDCRSANADRPRWFVDWAWVEDCLRRRSNMQGADVAQ